MQRLPPHILEHQAEWRHLCAVQDLPLEILKVPSKPNSAQVNRHERVCLESCQVDDLVKPSTKELSCVLSCVSLSVATSSSESGARQLIR